MNQPTKAQMGELAAFKNVIAFAHDNINHHSGVFVDGNYHEMRGVVIAAFKRDPAMKEFFRQCGLEATGGIEIHNNITMVPNKSNGL